MASINKGDLIPGWSVGFTAGKTVWQGGRENEVREAAKMFGVNVEKPPALITPTQAKKAGLPADIIKMYSNKKSGSARLEPVNFDEIKNLLGGK